MSSLFAMPFVVLNYGAEMVYILNDRLQAQSVTNEKTIKVMSDVAKAMFAPAFVNELMRPQPVYAAKALREIFDRLVQASIMRLSEASMDKLYDLMTMGCKLKVVTCRRPEDLVHLTLKHLEAIASFLPDPAAPASLLIQDARTLFERMFSTLSPGQLADVRHTVLCVFQDKRVKISMMLHEELQLPDGTLVLPRGLTGALPPYAVPNLCERFSIGPLGTVRYSTAGHPDFVESLPHIDVVQAPPPIPNKPAYATPWANLYNKSKGPAAAGASLDGPQNKQAPVPPSPVPVAPPQVPAAIEAAAPAAPSPPQDHQPPPPPQSYSPVAMPRQGVTVVPLTTSSVAHGSPRSSGGTGEGDLLSRLIPASSFSHHAAGGGGGHDNFKLALFHDDDDFGGVLVDGGGGGGGALSSSGAPARGGPLADGFSTLKIDRDNRALQNVAATWGPAAQASPHQLQMNSANRGGDDLLDLMDS